MSSISKEQTVIGMSRSLVRGSGLEKVGEDFTALN